MNKPVLVAKFVLDSKGSPKVAYKDSLSHYRIRLMVNNAPEDTYAVTYELHETYYEPVREARSYTDGFAEDITSYGDYDIRATIRGKHRNQVVVAGLSEALERGHGQNPLATIAKALANIKDN